MKKLILAAFALTTAASVFAQGTIYFNNNPGATILRTHIYAPLAGNVGLSQIGQGTADFPAGGANIWAGFTVIGAAGTGGQYGAATTLTSLLAAPGLNDSEASLLPGLLGATTTTTTFKTGGGAGFISAVNATFANIPADSQGGATVEMVVWDDSSGLYSTWALADVAWKAGLIAAGESGRMNISATIGGTGTPPDLLSLQSFNLYFVPEPTSFALAGLGAAAMMIFRRRK
jgi:hypothetical protein